MRSKKVKETYPCWVCDEPQDTAPNRLCIKCQCIVADMSTFSLKGYSSFKEYVRDKRGFKS